MLGIDRVLELLVMDRAWHSIDELAEKTQLRAEEIEEIVEFLATHQFISVNALDKRAKIEESTNRFLTRIHAEEKREHATFSEVRNPHPFDASIHHKT